MTERMPVPIGRELGPRPHNLPERPRRWLVRRQAHCESPAKAVTELIAALLVPVAASLALSHTIGPARGREETAVIVTLFVAAGAVLLAVIGRALLAPNDDIRP